MGSSLTGESSTAGWGSAGILVRCLGGGETAVLHSGSMALITRLLRRLRLVFLCLKQAYNQRDTTEITHTHLERKPQPSATLQQPLQK